MKLTNSYHWMNELNQRKVYETQGIEVAASISQQEIKSATAGCNEEHMTSAKINYLYFTV